MDKLVYKLQSRNLNIPLTNIYLTNSTTGVKPGELEVRDPRFWGGVSMKYYSFLKCKEIWDENTFQSGDFAEMFFVCRC